MKEEVLQLFRKNNLELNYKNIKKRLGITRQHKDEELKSTLKELELEGLLYYNEQEEKYQNMPSNFFVDQVEIATDGQPYIANNNEPIHIKEKYLNNVGMLNLDQVLFKKENDNIIPIKVLKRNNNYVVCEVNINKNKQKYLKVRNTKHKILVDIGSRALKGTKTQKALEKNDLVVVKLSEELYDDKYTGEFVEVIGKANCLENELETIAYNNGFQTRYTKEIYDELASIPDEVQEKDLKGRIDKRNDRVFTIDGDDTKDIDDAVEIEKLTNDNYLLKVSIAHVSHYIKPHTAIWNYAEDNTTSLYFSDTVYAMLHQKLSNGICSLNPNVDRLTRTFEMEINPFGDVVNFKCYKSVIRSKKKMTYSNVNSILENNIVPEGYEEYVDDLKLLYQLSKILIAKRQANGGIDIHNREITFHVNADGKIEHEEKNQGAAEKMIEYAMVITNYSVSKYYSEMLLPFIYRNHEFPLKDKIEEIYTTLNDMGYKINALKKIDDSKIVQRIINKLSQKEEFIVLSVIILKSLQRAYFSKDNKGHYGLAIDYYTQSTSPIRRYLDLVVHTLIDYYEEYEKYEDKINELSNNLEEMCKNATIKQRCAERAEAESNALYSVAALQNDIGKTFSGFISDVNNSSVKIKTTDLIDGVCYYDLSDSDYEYLPSSKALYNRKEKKSLHIGCKVNLILVKTDLANREIIFDILDLKKKKDLVRTKEKD